MSSVVISGNTSGSVSLVAPDVAGSSVQTLASVSGTLAPLVSGTAVTASGTSVDLTGIPSWAKRVTVMFSSVSTSGTSAVIVQLGDAGGAENSGYLGASLWGASGALASSAHTSGVLVSSGGSDTAAAVRQGNIVFTHLSANTWSYSGNLALTNLVSNIIASGTKSLSDVLTQVRITTVNGTDTFDAGTINIMYE